MGMCKELSGTPDYYFDAQCRYTALLQSQGFLTLASFNSHVLHHWIELFWTLAPRTTTCARIALQNKLRTLISTIAGFLQIEMQNNQINDLVVEEKHMDMTQETEEPVIVKKSVSIVDTRMAIRPFKTCPDGLEAFVMIATARKLVVAHQKCLASISSALSTTSH